MKKVCGLIIALLFSALMTVSAVSADEPPISIVIDGVADNDFTPVWNDTGNRIIISAQFFDGRFGAEVVTNADVTTVSKNGHAISFKESENRFIMDGIGGRNLESGNKTLNGEMYIPLRFMCEALGAAVDWNTDTGVVTVTTNAVTMPTGAAAYMKGVTLFDQATIRLEGEKIIYIDPYRIAGEPHDADVILVTHTHGDHFDLESISKLIKNDTKLFVTADGVDKALENGFEEVTGVLPNNEYMMDRLVIKTIPAYNTSKPNHPKERNFVGYIVTVNGVTYYAAGDTDYIPEMDSLNADVAFLPIDGRFNMEETEAARAANAIKPKVAVPYHYNNFSTEQNASNFVSQLDPDISGVIMTFKMYEE